MIQGRIEDTATSSHCQLIRHAVNSDEACLSRIIRRHIGPEDSFTALTRVLRRAYLQYCASAAALCIAAVNSSLPRETGDTAISKSFTGKTRARA